MIENSVGTNMFRNLYAEVDGERKDLTRDGDVSCANFVSTVLHRFDLIKEPHVTVRGTERDMKNSGWEEIGEPRKGCVLVWEAADFGAGEKHPHIGFYIGEESAVSTQNGRPAIHNWTFDGKRAVERMYWHEKLG